MSLSTRCVIAVATLVLGLGAVGCERRNEAASKSSDSKVASSPQAEQDAGGSDDDRSGGAASDDAAFNSDASALTSPDGVPQPDMTDMEEQVAKRLKATRAAILKDPGSAEAWGRFGMVAHAHELWQEAAVAYRRAQQLDLADARWPYFLGDVLSVVGTDLDAAAKSFRRALDLNPDYAPAHMRLGKVLVADNQPELAAKELRRALEIEPSLQPARVTLAQVQLARGKLDDAEDLLQRVLREEPRHAQALSTLGQIYMRKGRRDEARKIAQRARSAAIYNLYSDPLMGQVVLEGVSSVLIWERAKAFLDNGEFEQAARGLEMVVAVLPDNPDAHHQLASAYGSLNRPNRARLHLEKVIDLDPERADPRVQLAGLLIDYQKPEAALPQLKKALELAPSDPDAPWLLGRAQVLTGDVTQGLRTFEEADRTARAAGRQVPVWVHNEWGSALAQTGQPHTALDHFKIALEAEPNNPQSLFYMGLVLEGTGRGEEAVDHYCRSMESKPNPLAAGRLRALSRTCP